MCGRDESAQTLIVRWGSLKATTNSGTMSIITSMPSDTHTLKDFEQGTDAICAVGIAKGCIVFPYDPPPAIGPDFWLGSTEHWLSNDATDVMTGYHCDWPLYLVDGTLLTSANPPYRNGCVGMSA